MFTLFTLLLSFSESLAAKCLFLNNEPYMVRPTLVELSPVELKYYLFMISLGKCRGSCNVLSPEMCVPREAEDINVKAFNMITNKNEATAMIELISCNCKCKFNRTTCNSKQKWNKLCQCECKNYQNCRKNYSWIPSTCICDNSKYLKSISNTAVTERDEIIIVMDNLSTKKTNIMATNVTSTVSNHITINSSYYLL